MLFNSYGFIFLYLPLVLLGFFWLARISHVFSAAWLALASLFFYGYWNPTYVGLLLGSIVFNYAFGVWIARSKKQEAGSKLLFVAVASNLSLLAYYKYANFFVSGVNSVAHTSLTLGDIVLPLGISFFTFTQIAFLVDTYQNKVKEFNFIHYVLFVTYFPHLIAGPVLHHKEMMPQFSNASIYRFSSENMAVGSMIFFIGLFKKVILADGISVHVGPVFTAASMGVHLTFIEAWGGALCYALQLYFDFSGYSDMAIGLSRMFGVALPLNFHSPYKSANIIEFWRCWHMTLSRFLRDYLYIPLGGNRKGKLYRYMNLMTTMLLGGLWHGAGWTFVVWGGLHGFYLILNHAWHAVLKSMGYDTKKSLSKPFYMFSVLLTFCAVTVAWVFFRADSVNSALFMINAMIGMNGISWQATNGLVSHATRNYLLICLSIVWLAPNTQQIMRHYRPALDVNMIADSSRVKWQPTYLWMSFHLIITVLGLMSISELSEFIYFQF